jgi:hypothetical protein
MNPIKVILSFVLILVILSSCSVQKRYHRKGFTVTWNKTKTYSITKKQSTEANRKKDSLNRNVLKSSSHLTDAKSNLELTNAEKIEIGDNSLRSEKLNEVDSFKRIHATQKRIIEKLEFGHFQNFASNDPHRSTENGIFNKFKREKVVKSNSFDGAERSLGIAGIFLVMGLIVALIGALLSIQILGLISLICFCISGLFFMLFIFEGLLTILTFGML